LAIGLYAHYDRQDTIYDVRNHIAGDEPKEFNGSVRVKAVWAPTDWIKLTGSLDHAELGSFNGAAYTQVQYPALPYTLGATPSPPYVADYKLSDRVSVQAVRRHPA
jgi:hypothetical protein